MFLQKREKSKKGKEWSMKRYMDECVKGRVKDTR